MLAMFEEFMQNIGYNNNIQNFLYGEGNFFCYVTNKLVE